MIHASSRIMSCLLGGFGFPQSHLLPSAGLTSTHGGICWRRQASAQVAFKVNWIWCPAGLEESLVLMVRGSRLQMCVTGAGCVPVSERVCYRGMSVQQLEERTRSSEQRWKH